MSKTQNGTTRKLIFLLTALLVVVVMVRLGIWQLDRGAQKQQLLHQWHQPATELLLPIVVSQKYQRVQVSGVFDQQRYFLLDNRTRDGQVGYEVLALLTLAKNKTLLVNLGWLAAGFDRSVLPEFAVPVAQVTIKGWLKQVERSYQLANDVWLAGWPKRIQQVELLRIEEAASSEFLQTVILLNETPLTAKLITDWKPVNMSAQKHFGYAIQWFLMAFTLVVMVVWFYIKNLKEKGGSDE
jgi:cytochrome oxidase assembly protein ShyY1